jgi:dipeptidyl aminopeptidase/acylaminoacyl peptidase
VRTELDLRALLELRTALPLDVAEDGTILVGCDLPGSQQLYRISRDGELEQLTDFREPVAGRFEHATGRILLEMDASGNERTQLYLLDAEPGAEPEPLVHDPEFIHRSPHLSRDGSLLAYATNRRNGVDWDVVVRDLHGGEERVAFAGGFVAPAGFSPDATRLVVYRGTELSGDDQLWLVEVATGEATEIQPHAESASLGEPAWLPDSSAFFVASSVGRDTRAIVRWADGEATTTVESRWDLDCFVDDAARSLLVHENADGYSRLELRDPSTLEVRGEVPLPGRGVVEHPVFASGGSTLYFKFHSPVEPGDVWAYDLDTEDLRRVTELPRDVPVDELREPELHRFESFDGESVPLFLWEPDGDGPFPVVVMVHGGPEAQFLPGFLPSFTPFTQYLLAHGYAVVAPNVRGSSGYGKRYEHLDDVRLRLDSVRDLACLHEWLGTRPRIDAGRAVLYGRSYGGYMVLAGLAFQPERWAAGIESVGISSLSTFLENTSAWRRAMREREYGSLEHDRDFLIEASPITHVDRMRAPLLIQHGANDPRVPLSETEAIHRVLNEKGVRCELVVYEDEGHTIGKLENRVDFFERAVAFLDDVL